jgi:hypothetical protein
MFLNKILEIKQTTVKIVERPLNDYEISKYNIVLAFKYLLPSGKSDLYLTSDSPWFHSSILCEEPANEMIIPDMHIIFYLNLSFFNDFL